MFLPQALGYTARVSQEKIKVVHVVGARPNYMKIAPIMAEMAQRADRFEQVLVHTGQHYDANMSGDFFADLDLRTPDDFLQVGGGTHAEQTARVMLAFEPVLQRHRADWVVVAGDVNSTMACALVAVKLQVPVAHVEAGLRSRDWSMPEEINRVVTDRVSQLLFTPSRDGDENLAQEGVAAEKIRFVGNVMIDTLVRMLPAIDRQTVTAELKLIPKNYVLATLHRPSNVDDVAALSELLRALGAVGREMPVVFPVHPRTRQRIREGGLEVGGGVRLLEPLSYLPFVALMKQAALVMTDSGGVQEETTFLRVPCLTLRPNTERPVTITCGTNRLVASTVEAIGAAFHEALRAERPARLPELWDGKAAQRIVAALAE